MRDTLPLQEELCEVNRALGRCGLAPLTWGNASGVDRQRGLMAIKPSGVAYEALRPEHIVLVSLETGEPEPGSLRPSSDTPTHLHLYRVFPTIGGVVHTHSPFATAWAQAEREIPCLGTTHADLFDGPVPLTRRLTPEEVIEAYELHTGRVIEERFRSGSLDPLHFPGVLVAGHAPFVWGRTPPEALEHAVALEEVARIALLTLQVSPDPSSIPEYVLEKHFSRKHGPRAYYGQTSSGPPPKR